MPVHKVESDGSRIKLWIDSRGPHSDLDIVQMLIDQGGDKRKVAALIKQQMQDAIDVRIPLDRLPKEDPARQSNPNRPDFFWDGRDLVARSVIVEDVVWDGARYSPTLRRARQWR